MSETSPIEWTTDPFTRRAGATWSIVTGCTDADESCLWCYAKRLTATRLKRSTKYRDLAKMGIRGPQWSGEVRLHPDLLHQPLGWRGRRRIFVCSMSDLFHKDVPDEFLVDAWAAMWFSYALRGHLHLVLTKRAARACELLSSSSFPQRVRSKILERIRVAARRAMVPFLAGPKVPFLADDAFDWPFAGIHLGTSAGRTKEAIERWRWLSRAPAQARFLSLEPLIGTVDLGRVFGDPDVAGELPDQVIAGGESGLLSRCRPPHPDWFRSLRDRCGDLGIPFFFKQWGNYAPISPLYGGGDEALDRWGREPLVVVDLLGRCWHDGDGQPPPGSWLMAYTTKKGAGRELDGETFDGYPCACPSCYRPLDGLEPTHGCPGCGAFVCTDCKVDGLNRSAVCSGMCRGCWKDGRP